MSDPKLERTESIRPPSDPQELADWHRRNRADRHPDRIGPYRILEVLGEGGMGIVYLAEQEKPMHRRVALKVIKLGMDTKRVIARFDAEREALALMNHSNVAKVFDAGITEDGRPYFAMEHVPGIGLTDYCDKHRLNTEERLRLLIDVCHAVQHAHQKGIIHRDIKPSNVLVTVQNDKPVPKVIDFGVAKATQQRLAECTLFTEQGQLIGTPGYMSPEQAEMTALDLDTRTDIYSLGVLFYELLVGARPFDDRLLREAGFAGVQRIIREMEPPKPSTKFSGLGVDSAVIAHNRRAEPRAIARLLRGDLDWIVMKCLEKDRTRRYDTADGIALEIQRYLSNEPVLAGPPGASYRLRKLLRRNKGTVAAVGTIIAALATGLVLSDLQRRRAVRAETLAALRLTEAAQARDESETVIMFLTDTLASADPEKQGKDIIVREVLERAADKVCERFADRPLIQARLRSTVGSTYWSLGLYERADEYLADAAAFYYRQFGEQDRRTQYAMNNLAVVVSDHRHLSRTEGAQRSTLNIRRRVLGGEHPDTLSSMNDLANSLYDQGRYAEAEELHRQTLAIQHRVLGEEHQYTLVSMYNLGRSLDAQGRYVEAEVLHRKTVEISRSVLGEEHPNTLFSMNNLAANLYAQVRYAEAEEVYRQTSEITRRTLGEEHPDTLYSRNNVANSLRAQARYAEAETLYRQTLEIQRHVLGEKQPAVAATLFGLAAVLEKTQRWAEGEKLAREAESIRAAWLPPGHLYRQANANLLGGILSGLGRFSEAEPLLVVSQERLCADAGVPPPDKREVLERLVRLYEAWHAAEPAKGHDAKAADWRAKLSTPEATESK